MESPKCCGKPMRAFATNAIKTTQDYVIFQCLECGKVVKRSF